MHEYFVTHHLRHKILFYMAVISSFLSIPMSNFIKKILDFIHLDTIISFSISGFAIFSIIYWLFNNYVWKWSIISNSMNLPNISGAWVCDAVSHNILSNENFKWNSEIIITQKWDKILIVSKNAGSSTSKSIVAGIHFVEGKGYDVSYHYLNKPLQNQKDLYSHEGFCILCFSEDLTSAEGYYFNNAKERSSYGEMRLRRK